MVCQRVMAVWAILFLLAGCSAGGDPSNSTAVPQPSPPMFGVTPGSFIFTAQQGSDNPGTQTLTISNVGGGTLSWAATSGAPWLAVTPGTGANSGFITLTALTGTLTAATRTTTVTLSAPNATSVTIPVTFTVTPPPITSLVQQAYVKASNTTASSSFGSSVALDGQTMVVGAQSEGTSAVRSGAAYVFVHSGTTWAQQAFLKAPSIQADERFGTSVALSGDTLVVGAPAPQNLAGKPVGPGSAYVFTRSGATWILQTKIQASNAEISDRFGSSVALAGETLVVGASGEDSAVQWVIAGSPDETSTSNGATDSGAVYVFTRTNGVWTQQAYVKASNAGAGDGFGSSVALAGDTFVVGAEFETSAATGINGDQGSNSSSSSGAVYVFTLGNNGWGQEAYVKASNTGAGDRFGRSVALVGNTLAVGAPFEDSSARGINSNVDDNSLLGSGAVYLFTRLNGGWRQEAYIKELLPEGDDNFGSTLGLDDDILVVGAPGKNTNSGITYVFTKGKGTWTEQISTRAYNADANDNFGGRVALSGNTLVVGAIGESSKATGVNRDGTDNSESASGAAYVYVMQ